MPQDDEQNLAGGMSERVEGKVGGQGNKEIRGTDRMFFLAFF